MCLRISRVVVTLMLFAGAVVIAGCGGRAPSEGKWFDYGNGLVNLSQVNLIKASSSVLGAEIKFDNFTLTVAQYDAELDVKASEAKNKEILDENMKQIRDFLQGNATYVRCICWR